MTASNKGDSEEGQTPDTDDSGAHSEGFKRAPVMGHRGLEQRGKKARTYPPQPNTNKVVQVAALEVQNVKRAINRYGTLPKGARIGAYLESLRQSGLSEGQSSEAPPPHRSVSPRNNIRTQPGHMIRSNSSGGFQHHHHPPSSPRTRHTGRANSTETRPAQPSLADLEFPPPPPPEELDTALDVSNPQPSVEEASFRFGVSLRHREPSTDSCSSAKSEPVRIPSKTSPRPRDRPPSPPSHTPSQETKSPASEGQPPSPVVPPSPPPSPKLSKDDSLEDEGKKSPTSKVLKNAMPVMMKEMLELKLATETKEKSTTKGKDSPQSEIADITENSDTQTSPVDFKINLRKVSLNSDTSAKQESAFKAQLKKFEVKKEPDDKGNSGVMDLKSRLRKVDPNNTISTPPKQEEEEEGDDKRRSTGSISSLKKLWEGESSPPEVVKERRVWPPEEKPAVPTKPNVKTVSKPPAIYATPGILSSVMEIWQALETSLTSMKCSPSVSSASWLQLSDKVGLFHTSCLGYADSVAPPHARFHLRELLTRLEAQARTLRSAGARNQADNTKTLTELHNTLKDIVNAVQR